jgi:hypothetical protein
MFLASNAFQAGSLAASQPGLTIVDPLVAAALGVLLFGERLHHNPLDLLGEIVAVSLVVGSVVMLSRSPLVQEEDASPTDPIPPTAAHETIGGWVPGDNRPRQVRNGPTAPTPHGRRVSAEVEAP